MKNYDHKKIESKWQKEWEKEKIYQAKTGTKGKKFYGLIEFPYPSGAGLHVGHIRSNTAMDIITRKRRMEGYNVLYPIGWDAFGLPTENYAIKTGIQPAKVTKTNTDIFRKQLKSVGFGFDWSREINTTDPAYFKWTQWIFLQMFKKGLAYKTKTEINWCPSCKIGLANEEVVGGLCDRCGGPTGKKEKEQWMLAITKYAKRLDADLDKVNYLEKIKIQQRNWIGKSDGSEIEFPVFDSSEKIKVFTTRADTIFGATYVVLAPEHELVKTLSLKITNLSEVLEYIKSIADKPEIERTAEDKVKTGVELKGIKAINPANGKEIPIWIADYVLATYGTGAIMAVPEHDIRDREFATKFNLPIIDEPLVEAGEITKKVGGKIVTKFKLRDWVFSRQRYWGEPIPIVNCAKCGHVPVPEKDLPILLPKVKSYTPTDNGESPLASISKWVNTTCPICHGKAKRETDTMPNWAGSSWYYLRYADPKNKKELASKKSLSYWMKNGVDWYNGGMEHTTLHLLYSRFWHKFLFDLKLVPTSEPYMKRTSHGMILAEGGVKMSKSIGNTVDPKDIVNLYGADTLRVYEMFIGPFDQAVSWSTESIIGSRRFLDKIWRLSSRLSAKSSSKEVENILHKTIKKISEDIESLSFNTAISSMMVLVNEMDKAESIAETDFKMFLQILAPFAPHLAEDIWQNLGKADIGKGKAKRKIARQNFAKSTIHLSAWPKWNKKKIVEESIKIAVQVNGKVRAELTISKDISSDEVKALAIADKNIETWILNKEIKRIIYVPGRIINIVI